MKKNFLFALAVTIVVAASPHFSFGQSTLNKVWEQDAQRDHSASGTLIATYSSTTATDVITVSVVSYTYMNVSMRTGAGDLEWSKDIDIPDYSYWAPSRLVIDANGNPIVSGEVYNASQFSYNIFVLKLNNDGNLEWIQKFSDQRHYLSLTGMDKNGDGSNVYLSYWFVVYTQSGKVKSVIETAKLDGSTGATVWEKELLLDNGYAAVDALLYDQSGIYQTGYVSDSNFNYSMLTFKYDEDGAFQWKQTYSSTGGRFSFSQGTDLAVNSANRLVVAGTENYHTLVALGYSTDGNLDFVRKQHFGSSSYAYNARVEDKGNGTTFVACEADSFGVARIYLTGLMSNGQKSWDEYVAETYFNNMKVDPSGESVSILGSYYDFDINNYVTQIHSVSESGITWLSYEFTDYPGYNAIADFVTPDGNSYYLEGSVFENFFRSNEMTSRWDVAPLRTSGESNAGSLTNATIYPNPCTDHTTISLSNISGVIRIYDVSGKLFYQSNQLKPVQQIDTRNWPAGVYIVKFDNGQQQPVKFVKE